MFLTALKHPLLIARVEKSGAEGCLLKKDSVQELMTILGEIRAGATFVLSQSLEELGDVKVRNLSPREFEILGLIAKGSLNKEIARKLGVSEHTVVTHRQRIKDKTGAFNAADLATVASELGLL